MSDLVGNPEDRFSHNEARLISNFVFSAFIVIVPNIQFSLAQLLSVDVQTGLCR